MLEQFGDSEPIWNLAMLAIDCHFHGEISADGIFERERMVNLISSLAEPFCS